MQRPITSKVQEKQAMDIGIVFLMTCQLDLPKLF